MKVKIGWLNKDGLEEIQTKKFTDEMSAIQWCRMHKDNITMINGTKFKLVFGAFVSSVKELGHFEIMMALKKGEKK